MHSSKGPDAQGLHKSCPFRGRIATRPAEAFVATAAGAATLPAARWRGGGIALQRAFGLAQRLLALPFSVQHPQRPPPLLSSTERLQQPAGWRSN